MKQRPPPGWGEQGKRARLSKLKGLEVIHCRAETLAEPWGGHGVWLVLVSQRGHSEAGSGTSKHQTKTKHQNKTAGCWNQWPFPNEGLFLRGCSRAQEVKGGSPPLRLCPAGLPLAPPTGRAQQGVSGKAGRRCAEPRRGITEQCIETVASGLRDNNFVTGEGAFVSSPHHLCFSYVVQPQWNLEGSLRETSEYNLFVLSLLR